MADTIRASMSVGQLAERTGIKAETIRYYERIGLLPPSTRAANGHRHYAGDVVGRLIFVHRAREIGFTLDDVRALLHLADAREPSCARVHDIAAAHLGSVRSKLTDLQAVESVLAEMVRACESGVLPGCPIIEALSHTPPPPKSQRRRRPLYRRTTAAV
ncbi:MAG: helix-turn-helix domain-containing protein [Proteobacteria bacterium]|nr:helix-turn-helix domain-containing protein [Pseudomonadota bacterium]